jgi:hypothetical protein
MGWRFRRRVKILPGITLNFSKSGVSTSVGWRGYHKTFSKKGVRTTAGIPGTGISYTEYSPKREGQSQEVGYWVPLLVCIIIVGGFISVCHRSKPNSPVGVSATAAPSASSVVETSPIVEATPESTPTPVTVKRAELVKLPTDVAEDTAADEDLNRAWRALTPAQRRHYRQEERDWIKYRDSLPTVQERNETTRKRAEYLWSLNRKD